MRSTVLLLVLIACALIPAVATADNYTNFSVHTNASDGFWGDMLNIDVETSNETDMLNVTKFVGTIISPFNTMLGNLFMTGVYLSICFWCAVRSGNPPLTAILTLVVAMAMGPWIMINVQTPVWLAIAMLISSGLAKVVSK